MKKSMPTQSNYFFKSLFPIAFLIFTLVSVSCEREDETQFVETEPFTQEATNAKVSILTANDVPQVIEKITAVTKRNKSSLNLRDDEDSYYLDTERIYGVTDSVGNKTYALKLYLPNGREDAFYNLLVTERSEGEDIPMAVLEYVMEPDYFVDLANGTKRDSGYDRNIYYYSFEDFSYISLASIGTYEELPDPCGEMEMSSGGGTGLTGGTEGNGSGSGAGPGVTYTNGTGTTGGGGGISHSSPSPGVEIGDGCFCELYMLDEGDEQKNGSRTTGKEDNCPEGELLVPVNENTTLNEEEILEELAPDTPIDSMEEFLSCYNTSQSATFTIYANQPISNSSASISVNLDVGHAFVSISQNGRTSTFGFYPEADGLKGSYYGDSVMGNNGGDSFDVSLSTTISGHVLGQIINKAKQYNSSYDLYNYNCTDYAIELANLAGMGISNAWGPYPSGSGGDNPGKLGQILRTRQGANTSGGNAPSKSSGCN